METKETVIEQKFQSNLNWLIENTLKGEQKMEEELYLFFNNNASHQKKKVQVEQDKTVQHDKNKVSKCLDQHILQQGKGRKFL